MTCLMMLERSVFYIVVMVIPYNVEIGNIFIHSSKDSYLKSDSNLGEPAFHYILLHICFDLSFY